MGFRKYRWLFVLGIGLTITCFLLPGDWVIQVYSGSMGRPMVVQAQTTDASELRWEGQRLVLEKRCDEAISLLNQAIDLYRAETADPGTSELQRDSNMISELMIYAHLAGCYAEMNDYENLLTTLRTSIDIRNQLAAKPHLSLEAEAGLTTLPGWIDTWRGRLPSDTERIEVLEASRDFFNDLTWVLAELKNPEAALVAAEKGRARAIADLLTVNQFENPSDRATLALAPTLEKIRQTAQAHQITLVEYAIMASEVYGEDSLFAWAVEPSGDVHFESIPLGRAGRSLKAAIAASRQALGGRLRGGFVPVDSQPEDQQAALRDLYDLLIARITGWLPSDDQALIAFIPQDELFLVPFPTLLDENDQPFITTHTLLTAPSIQVLELTYQRQSELQHADTANNAEALLVGNPTMPPMPDAESILEPLQQLPGAENEVKEIGRLLGATPLLEDAASETTVKQRIGTASIIHLATHNLLEYGAEQDDQPPGAIALAPDDINNGFLTSAEILQLDLNAELVVLSACDTGLGDITGDGVVGLARSLITAGTSSVVVSLWSVPDAPTANLMTEFYHQMQQGQDKAQALRQAMLKTMEQNPDPRDWAAFTLIGSSD